MNKKYNIKLKNNRIVGPFVKEQIGALYLRGQIDGSEEFQLFPEGQWGPLEKLTELYSFFLELINRQYTLADLERTGEDLTVVKILAAKNPGNADNIPSDQEEKRKLKEFQYPKGGVNPVSTQAEESPKEEARNVDKTKLVRVAPPENKYDKTIKIKMDAPPLEAKDLNNSPDQSPISVITTEPEKQLVPVDFNEKTQIVDVKELMPDIKNIAQQAEAELEQQIKLANEPPKIKEEIIPAPVVRPADLKRPINRKRLIIFAVTILGLMIIFSTNAPKQATYTNIPYNVPQLVFPISDEYADDLKAKEFLEKAKAEVEKNKYLSLIKAAFYYKISLEKRFKDNEALGKLILTYSKLFPNIRPDDKVKEAGVIVKLLEIAQKQMLTDANVNMGAAQFFVAYGRNQTAINTLENFLRVNKPKSDQWPSFLAIYLNAVLKVSDMVKAKGIFDKIVELKIPSIDSALAAAKFLIMNKEFDRAKEIIVQVLKKFPDSVPLYLELADYTFRNKDYEQYEVILKKILELEAENCPLYVAKYYEQMGMLYATKKNVKTTAFFFKKALAINESDELRSKLAALDLGGGQKVEELILESKIIELVRMSKVQAQNKNWEDAFRLAIEAADISEHYIPSQLWLADIQVQRGFYKSAIQTLLSLLKEYPMHPGINFSLAKAYVEARLLDEADKQLQKIAQTTLNNKPEYASLLGQVYAKKGSPALAARWLQEAINRNPMSDQDNYLLAQVFFKANKFDKSKMLINKAITLNPEEIEYHSLYAKILYELETTDAAIGYLRDLESKYPNNSRILGDIATLYHRSGQIKMFNEYHKKVKALPAPDINFYLFLIQSANTEEKAQDVVNYSLELLKLVPGDLDVRMNLAEYLFDQRRYEEAKDIFIEIYNRLPSYPRVNYFLSTIYLLKTDLKKAQEFAEEEVKYNPRLEAGYISLGAIYTKTDQYPQAIREFEKALSINAESVEALFQLADIKFRQRDYNMAREYYQRVLKKEQRKAEAHRQLGYIYRSVGQGRLAIESLKVYLDLYPNAPDRARIEKEIEQLK
jgi:tetratricopeptide (TPR) repeat protein